MSTLKGSNINLRLANEDDAAFVWSLRTDPRLSDHLSPTTGGVAAQRAWLHRYKTREHAGNEFYFVVERNDGVPCGLVRLYDLTDDAFVFGSFIIGPGKPRLAALETALLAFGYGFNQLDRFVGRLDVRRKNDKAIRFYRRFGAREVRRDNVDLYFELAKPAFEARRAEFEKIIAEHQG